MGGGAAGALVAVNLLPKLQASDEVFILDPAPELGKGAPYGTSDPSRLLNVRAGNMSGLVDVPSHFAHWLARREQIPESDACLRFAPRGDYGRYISELLQNTIRSSACGFRHVQGTVVSIDAAEHRLITSAGATESFDALVIATGHLPPLVPATWKAVEKSERFIRNPWQCQPSDFNADDEILILGTGLTMVDVVLSLVANGHRGRIRAVSRRGKLPQTHRATTPITFDLSLLDDPRPLKAISRHIRSAGPGWAAAIDGMRPLSAAIWARLGWQDRARFVQRLRPYWDIHRHRIPSESADILSFLEQSGQLVTGPGRIRDVTESAEGIRYVLDETPRESQWVINCTGPNIHLASAGHSLLDELATASWIQYDPLGLGILITENGRASASENVWALGPVCRGCRWETIAIPEIRVQARDVAAEIVQLSRRLR